MPKIKPLMFNTAGFKYKEYAPALDISEEAGGESDHSETELEPPEA